MNPYVKLEIAALTPAFLAVIFYELENRSSFGKWNKKLKQLLIGIAFGGLAILGTEWGVSMNGAMINCRDASVLTAGLLFGGPSGIIAGLIGGVERWIAAAWGAGYYTRLACSVSTIIAGFFAAFLRKYLFEDHRPEWSVATAVGVVMEVFHLTMVFITNVSKPEKAMTVVESCSFWMIVSNGVSLMVASLILKVLSERRQKKKDDFEIHAPRISQTIRRWLLASMVIALALTGGFSVSMQNSITHNQTEGLLSTALHETETDLKDVADAALIAIAHKVQGKLDLLQEPTSEELLAIGQEIGVAEINLIDRDNIIFQSTNPEYVGYDLQSGRQSRAFLDVMRGKKEAAQDYGPVSFDPSIERKYAGIKTDYGMLQVGYNADEFLEEFDNDIINITKNRHVGKSGYLLILDADNKVVSSPSDKRGDLFRFYSMDLKTDKVFSAVLMGEKCRIQCRQVKGYTILAVLPEEEALQGRNAMLYVNTFMEILVFAVLFGMVYKQIKVSVVDKIESVNKSLNRITEGNLDEVVDVRTSHEFTMLSDDINSTVDTLKKYIDEASARIDQELEIATSIQSSSLPNPLVSAFKKKEFDIFACMDPAKEVGGDFYDFYFTGSDLLHFLIADVSGKGIPGAMFMMRAKTELKSLTENGATIDTVFTGANDALCEGNKAGMFVTAWQGNVDLNTGLVRFANAGHNPPLVRRSGGKFEYLRTRAGFVLAGMEGFRYKSQEMQLSPGDIIFLYTDGVTEATNAATEMYGEERLMNILNAVEYTDMKNLCELVKADVDAFVADAPQADDITMLALQYKGPEVVPSLKLEEAVLEDIPKVTAFVEGEMEKMECPMKAIIAMNVAIDEVFSNIVRYAYPKGPGPVTVTMLKREDPRGVGIQFRDWGTPYNPLEREDPDVTLSAEERSIGGLGIFMVKKTMQDLQYRYEDSQNIFTFYKSY